MTISAIRKRDTKTKTATVTTVLMEIQTLMEVLTAIHILWLVFLFKGCTDQNHRNEQIFLFQSIKITWNLVKNPPLVRVQNFGKNLRERASAS